MDAGLVSGIIGDGEQREMGTYDGRRNAGVKVGNWLGSNVTDIAN